MVRLSPNKKATTHAEGRVKVDENEENIEKKKYGFDSLHLRPSDLRCLMSAKSAVRNEDE